MCVCVRGGGLNTRMKHLASHIYRSDVANKNKWLNNSMSVLSLSKYFYYSLIDK